MNTPPPNSADDPANAALNPSEQSIDDSLAGLPRGYPLRSEYEYAPREFAALLANSSVIGASAGGPGPTKSGATTAKPAVMLIDVRTGPEWDFAHIAGSVHAPLDQLEQLASHLPLAEADEIGVICHHGVRSIKGVMILRSLGFATAKSIAGGIEAWSLGVDPNVPRYERQGLKVWAAPR